MSLSIQHVANPYSLSPKTSCLNAKAENLIALTSCSRRSKKKKPRSMITMMTMMESMPKSADCWVNIVSTWSEHESRERYCNVQTTSPQS